MMNKCRLTTLILVAVAAIAGRSLFLQADDGPKASGNSPATALDVPKLIGQLNAPDFKIREAAEKALKGCSRAALAELNKFKDSDEPEIRARVREIIHHIRINPANIPQCVYAFDPQPAAGGKTWEETLKAWNDKAKIPTEHVKGTEGTSGWFAQSFIPHCTSIKAVELKTAPYPDNGAGWFRVDLCPDELGLPGKVGIARSWVRVDQKCPANIKPGAHTCEFVLYNFPETKVEPNGTYWLVFNEFRDDGDRTNCLTNWVVDTKSDYSEGKLLFVPKADSSRKGWTANFRILSECGPPPMMHKATEQEMKSLPEDAIPTATSTPD